LCLGCFLNQVEATSRSHYYLWLSHYYVLLH
jgi:hypothetical protein